MLRRLLDSVNVNVGKKSLNDWASLFIEYMQHIDHEFDPGHRIDHVLRVAKSAIELGIQEKANLAVIVPAALLHDTKPVGKFDQDRAKASLLSAENSIKLLESWGYPARYYPAIQHAILTHSFSANIAPTTLEAKVVQDADRLDALGAIGIARTIAIGSQHGNPLYNFEKPFPSKRVADDHANIVDHFYIKLFQLPNTLHTTAAKAEAVTRIKTMESYLQALANEIGVRYLSYNDYLNMNGGKQTSFCNDNVRSNLIWAGTLDIKDPNTLQLAMDAGYTYFDLATAYEGAHQALGTAMQGKHRADFHICTKINDADLLAHGFSVESILKTILTELQTTYVDTLLLHSPASLLHDNATAVLEELIALKAQGVIKHIGVSNFEANDLNRLGKSYRRHIEFNQIELNPYCQQQHTVDYCGNHNIKVMAYRPFGKGKADDLLKNPTLIALAKQHNNASVQQIILAWLTQRNIIAIPKASSKAHLEANRAACDITLSSKDMQAIADLDRKLQTCDWKKFAKMPHYQDYLFKPLKRSANPSNEDTTEKSRVTQPWY